MQAHRRHAKILILLRSVQIAD